MIVLIVKCDRCNSAAAAVGESVEKADRERARSSPGWDMWGGQSLCPACSARRIEELQRRASHDA